MEKKFKTILIVLIVGVFCPFLFSLIGGILGFVGVVVDGFNSYVIFDVFSTTAILFFFPIFYNLPFFFVGRLAFSLSETRSCLILTFIISSGMAFYLCYRKLLDYFPDENFLFYFYASLGTLFILLGIIHAYRKNQIEQKERLFSFFLMDFKKDKDFQSEEAEREKYCEGIIEREDG